MHEGPYSRGTRARRVTALVVGAVLLVGLAGCSTTGGTASAFDAVPDNANVYLAIPHPDDEFQNWGLIENSNYFKVFILMTRGEATGFCTPEGFSAGYQIGLEPAPRPIPTAKYDETCVDARLNSALGFLHQMSMTDSTIPGDFAESSTVPSLEDPLNVVCSRMSDTHCTQSNTSAEVWADRHGRGTVIAFDLGDGNLTVDEVTWAIQAVRSSPELFGIDATRPSGFVAGAYANDNNPFCYQYPHPDHLAVGSALRTVEFSLGLQFVAACGFPWESQLQVKVSDKSTDAAFHFRSPEEAVGAIRQGAHESHYGWLNASVYPVDRTGQHSLFMQNQTFVLTKDP